MTKHHKTTPAEDLSPIASRLPWWASVLIAAGAWFIFHSIATSQPAPISNPHEFSSLVTGQVFRTFAELGQCLLPPFFLMGASTSVVGRTRRRCWRGMANAAQPGKALDGIGWQQFEWLVGEIFLVRRVAKRGINSRGVFWDIRYIRDVMEDWLLTADSVEKVGFLRELLIGSSKTLDFGAAT